jgi:tetratricopeptide (TPR) repeat protein
MPEALDYLSQRELMALVSEAMGRGDSGHAMAYLKAAVAREDRTPEALFILGSEYAQLKLMDEAEDCMSRAVAQAPVFWVARFQLGLLHLTSGRPAQAQAVWAPLAGLADDDAKVYLKRFHQGLLHLIADEFAAAMQMLHAGIALNPENEPLNVDMRRIIDAVAHLPGNTSAPPADPARETSAPGAAAPAAAETDVEPSHLFISAYATRGKPH